MHAPSGFKHTATAPSTSYATSWEILSSYCSRAHHITVALSETNHSCVLSPAHPFQIWMGSRLLKAVELSMATNTEEESKLTTTLRPLCRTQEVAMGNEEKCGSLTTHLL